MAVPPDPGQSTPSPLPAVPSPVPPIPSSPSAHEQTLQIPYPAPNPSSSPSLIPTPPPLSNPSPATSAPPPPYHPPLLPIPTQIPPLLNPLPAPSTRSGTSQPLDPHPLLPGAHPTPHSVPPSSSTPRGPLSLPPKSYALAARGPKGSGFVRSHASAVESFARLPRTGVNIICGSREGIPSFSFANSDLPIVEELYANALVLRFLGGRPSLEASHREIQSWGVESPFSIGPLSSRAFLLRFQDERDLIRVLSRPSTILITFPYKVFRWHNLCHKKEDSCYAPVWISLPRVPLQCFIPEFLESVANKIGRFLCFDKATATLARPSAARLCVELDLRSPPPQFIWIGLFEGLKQPIIYERMPKFCNSCQAQGHLVAECPLGHRETLPHQPGACVMAPRGRTPTARRNADGSSSSTIRQLDIPTAASASLPTPTPTPFILVPPRVPPLQTEHHQPPNTEPNPSVNTTSSQPVNPPPPPPKEAHPPPAQPHTSHISPTTPHSTRNKDVQKRKSVACVSLPALANQPSSLPPPQANQPGFAQSSTIPSQAKPSFDIQQRKSVTGASSSSHSYPQQEANSAFWDAVNRQIAIIDQARLHNSTFRGDSPSSTIYTTTPATVSQVFQSANPSFTADPHTDAPTPILPNAQDTNEASNGLHKTSNSSAVSPAFLVVDKQPGSSNKYQKSATKSTNFMPFEGGNSTSIPQPQAEALERFKNKILEQTRVQGNHLSIPNSVNQFEALLEDHSDEDDYVASYNSDTDDGCVEPIDMGYQSADGRSSYNAPSSMKINKRHPNMPLNVRLRSRKRH